MCTYEFSILRVPVWTNKIVWKSQRKLISFTGKDWSDPLDSKNHIGACRYHPKQTLIIFVLDPSQIDYRFGRGSIRRFQSMFHGARFNLKWQEPILLVMNCPPQAEIFYLYVAKIHKIKGFSNDLEHKYWKNPRLRRAFFIRKLVENSKIQCFRLNR